jgi:serine/threonine protein kinase
MELCDGNLHGYVKAMPETDANLDRLVIGQVVVALSYLHDKNIIHKDLNPNNILFKRITPCIPLMKLADFGFSRECPNDKKSFNYTEHKGTLGYVSPELEQTGKPSFASDVWALGAVVYFTITRGDHPYKLPELDNKIMPYVITKLRNAPNVHKVQDWSAAELICRLLNYDKSRRPNISHVLFHPFFIVSNESAKTYLAIKLNDFYFNNRDTELVRVHFQELFQESKIKAWYENLDDYLRNDEDSKDVDDISRMVIHVMSCYVPITIKVIRFHC